MGLDLDESKVFQKSSPTPLEVDAVDTCFSFNGLDNPEGIVCCWGTDCFWDTEYAAVVELHGIADEFEALIGLAICKVNLGGGVNNGTGVVGVMDFEFWSGEDFKSC